MGSHRATGAKWPSSHVGAVCTLLVIMLSSFQIAAIEILEPGAIQGFYTHYRVESSEPLSTTKITGDVFVPAELPNGSDLPQGIMIINREHYGVDPVYGVDPLDNTVSWVERAAALNVKAILLEEYEGNMLYRRWDPYTLFNIPVVQVKARQNLTATLFPLTPSVLDP